MLAQQRHREILRRIAARGGARVAELARALRVTEETIRRDLDRLGREGRLLRTHGGALPVEEASRDEPFDVRRTAHHEEKVAIARRALAFIAEGDVIALDASSTVHELTRLIPDIPLTVVTNSLLASVRLLSRRQVRVLATGGLLDPASCAWVGSLAERALERVNISKLFLSAKGLDLERGLSEVDDAQARVKRRMLELAERRFLLLDHSKLNVRSIVWLADLAEVDVIITGPQADGQVLRALKRARRQVELAE